MAGCGWVKAVIGPLLIVMAVCFVTVDLKFEQCMFPKPRFNPELEVLRYGKPTAFVATRSIGLSPYALTDPYRQSALYHEYLLVGPGIATHTTHVAEDEVEEMGEEEIQLILYDEEAIHSWENDPNLVQQNLAKEYFWALINATGMLPSMTVINATFEKTFRFHTDEKNEVAYQLSYPNLFRSQEAVPPLDVVFEFPAKTRMFQSLKTMIDYQTFGLLRWRLTPADPVPWSRVFQGLEWDVTIKDPKLCNVPPRELSFLTDPEFLRCIYAKRLRVLENPCIKDMIIWYGIYGKVGVVGDDDSFLAVNRLVMVIPMVYDVLDYEGWIDLTEAYCPDPDVDEECGEPLDIVLTNDHLLILTDKGLWVSNSLNTSNCNASYPYSMKPLIKFTPIDPCAQFANFNCTEVGAPILARQAVRKQRLFYTPICHLFQYPIYEDMVMLAIDHISQAPDMSEERDVLTVLYSAKPYNDWKILFHARHEYISKDGPLAIADLLGIFFNHHRRHFDITMLLRDPKANWAERTIRFVLPLPDKPNFQGYPELSGLLGNGFIEFEFPPTFHMTHLTVFPEPLDIFFLGNEIWIAEAAGPFVYLSVPFVSYTNNLGEHVESVIGHCSFNHPDRTFVCVEKSHQVLYPGRVGITYSTPSIVFSDVNELRFTMLHNVWPFAYRQYSAILGHIVAGYSGKIMVWYVHAHSDLTFAQQILVDKMNSSTATCNVPAQIWDKPVACHVCRKLTTRVFKHNCKITDLPVEPVFRMLAIDPTKFKSRDTTPDGPLVPFLLDGDKVVLFEASIRDLDGFKPSRDYLTEVDLGGRIFCTVEDPQRFGPPPPPPLTPVPSSNSTSATAPTGPPRPYEATCPSINLGERKSSCEMFVGHMKDLERNGKQVFLKGFRRVHYATVIQSFPLRPIPTDMVILVLPNSNEAVIQLSKFMFELQHEYTFQYGDIGQTLYVPEHFSVLLTGFPKFQECISSSSPLLHDMTRVVGLTTRYYRQGARIVLKPFQAYLVDFSTPKFCEWYRETLRPLNTSHCVPDPYPSDLISAEDRQRRAEMDERRTSDHESRERLSESINKYYEDSFVANRQAPLFEPLEPLDPPTYQDEEDELLTIPIKKIALGEFKSNRFMWNKTYDPDQFNPDLYLNKSNLETCKTAWQIYDGGCHLRLFLSKNPVLRQNGGRISLDKHDSISFQVKLTPLTPTGKSLIHRPLMDVSNTNPTILNIDQTEASGRDIQIMNLTLSPTGFGTGVATVTIRPLIVSNECQFADGSFTLIVQVQRAPGKRLHVNYPIPICKPGPDEGEYERPWKIDLPSCVSRQDLLELKEVKRPNSVIGQVFYSAIPVNYRPPSDRGSEIPFSDHLYNVDPSKPWYHNKYRISKETGKLNKCRGKKDREHCDCSANDILSDDAAFSDCKQVVYTAKRGFRVDISVEYDRIMRDEDQHVAFFSPKRNWSVSIEEINKRREFTVTSDNSPYLDLINSQPDLNLGVRYYDAKTLGVTLHGTGLFHFKVALGHFESFGEVSGHFIILIPDDELNHVQLVVVMLLTITVCMAFVFCGFLLVRKRLSSQLPFQPRVQDKIKLE